MNDLKEIVRLLNSSDFETVALGLEYLKKCDLEWPEFNSDSSKTRVVYKHYSQCCDEIINLISTNTRSLEIKYLLDNLIWALIGQNPNVIELKEYIDKVSKDYPSTAG